MSESARLSPLAYDPKSINVALGSVWFTDLLIKASILLLSSTIQIYEYSKIAYQSPATFSVATRFLSHTVVNFYIYMTIIPNDYFGTFFMEIMV